MSSQHTCVRCGHEDRCAYGSWYDRHPNLAVLGGLLTLVWMSGVFAAYPSVAFTMTGLVAGGVGVRFVAREYRRRQALAARADYEHARMMERQTMPPIRLASSAPMPPRPRPDVVIPPPYTQPIDGRRLR